MNRISLIIASLLCAVALYAYPTVSRIGAPLTSVDQIVDGGKYMLHNVGRNRWMAEDGYAALVFYGEPVPGPDRSNDYVFTLSRDADGCFMFATRRGRYIPEVDESTPLTVGSAERAGHFVIAPSGSATFTIVNTVDTRYGFDGTAAAFVGWNAAKGANCHYEIVPVEFASGHYPVDEYTEPMGGEASNPSAWLELDADGLSFSWASKDIQYARHEVPALRIASDTIVNAWRGERIGLQAIAFSRTGVDNLTLELQPLADGNGNLIADAQAAWTRYVMTDDNRSCGDHAETTVWTVPDVIDLPGTAAAVEDNGVRPAWCTIEVPSDIRPGLYSTTLNLYHDGKLINSLGLKVNVLDLTLPDASDYSFHLDFWQQPYAVSRYYGVERFSDEHFELMRPYMQALARAGQKVVTAILFHEPWGRQSYDKFDPMVETTLRGDGSWGFDFSRFDKWVEFMAECGISSRINCYSMVPWDMSFRYLDEATDTYRYLKTSTSTDEYSRLWTSFLTAFADHLTQKGWFEKTAIGMDERGLGAMRDAIALVNSAAPGLKIALAGNYHAEITSILSDYSIAYSQRFPAGELARRRAAGQISTFYVSCADPKVNIFTNNAPSDAACLPVRAIALGLDGILHWSWLNWPENPLTDSRLQLPEAGKYTFAPGDTYSFYPGPRSSVRFERLIEGIQQTEKIRLLRRQWTDDDNSEMIAKLDAALLPFTSDDINGSASSATMVADLEKILNEAPEGDDTAVSTVGIDESYWSGHTLYLNGTGDVTVYSLSGVILHRSNHVSAYSMEGYTPGQYLIRIDRGGVAVTTFKFIR